MSTDISDLPGPTYEEEEVEQEVEYERGNHGYGSPNFTQQAKVNSHGIPQVEKYDNVSATIKKKHRKVQEHFSTDLITQEFNTSNLLVLAVIYLATLPQADEYTRKFLAMLPFNLLSSGSTIINIVKCVLLVVLYIVFRDYILPRFQ